MLIALCSGDKVRNRVDASYLDYLLYVDEDASWVLQRSGATGGGLSGL